jgi:hypothetical protein
MAKSEEQATPYVAQGTNSDKETNCLISKIDFSMTVPL